VGDTKHQAPHVAQVDLRFGIACVLPVPPGLFTGGTKAPYLAMRNRHKEVVEHMEKVFRETRSILFAGVLLGYTHLETAAKKIFDSTTGSSASWQMIKSGALEALTEEQAEDDETYQRARGFSHIFRDGLLEFFFDPKSELDNLTRTMECFEMRRSVFQLARLRTRTFGAGWR